MSTVIVNSSQRNPGCLVQILWFIFIGWWLGALWISLAWLFMLTVIGIPIAVKMINMLPQIIAQRKQGPALTITTIDGATVVSAGNAVPQHNIILRTIYFLLIGWWFSGLWMSLAYLICLTIIGLPIGFWMFDRTPAILSLRRS